MTKVTWKVMWGYGADPRVTDWKEFDDWDEANSWVQSWREEGNYADDPDMEYIDVEMMERARVELENDPLRGVRS